MRDLSTLKTKLSQLRSDAKNPPPVHRIRVPLDIKDELKLKGAKFNGEIGWHFTSHVPEEHPLGKYRVGGGRWVEVSNVPFDVREDLKQAGMVGEKTTQGWFNYVHVENEELIALLIENEELNIKLTEETDEPTE